MAPILGVGPRLMSFVTHPLMLVKGPPLLTKESQHNRAGLSPNLRAKVDHLRPMPRLRVAPNLMSAVSHPIMIGEPPLLCTEGSQHINVRVSTPPRAEIDNIRDNIMTK